MVEMAGMASEERMVILDLVGRKGNEEILVHKGLLERRGTEERLDLVGRRDVLDLMERRETWELLVIKGTLDHKGKKVKWVIMERKEVGDNGPQGIPGLKGTMGENGMIGGKGEKGEHGIQKPSGSVYIRWGRTVCPSVDGTELIYSGRTGGSGAGNDYVCFPDDPEYSASSATGYTSAYAVEYNSHPIGITNHNAPCAVCYTSTVSAKLTCPTNWTVEYTGYLMTDESGNGVFHSQHVCVDETPESIPGLDSDNDPFDFSIN